LLFLVLFCFFFFFFFRQLHCNFEIDPHQPLVPLPTSLQEFVLISHGNLKSPVPFDVASASGLVKLVISGCRLDGVNFPQSLSSLVLDSLAVPDGGAVLPRLPQQLQTLCISFDDSAADDHAEVQQHVQFLFQESGLITPSAAPRLFVASERRACALKHQRLAGLACGKADKAVKAASSKLDKSRRAAESGQQPGQDAELQRLEAEVVDLQERALIAANAVTNASTEAQEAVAELASARQVALAPVPLLKFHMRVSVPIFWKIAWFIAPNLPDSIEEYATISLEIIY
jgi:hypothetical protein